MHANSKLIQMKKFLVLLFMAVAAFAYDSQAQLVKTTVPTKDSVVNTDNTTVTIGTLTGDVKSIHITGTKASGTIVGKVYLDVSIDGTNYYLKDSVTIVDGATIKASFELPYLYYAAYRMRVSTTGTQKITGIRGKQLRRSN